MACLYEYLFTQFLPHAQDGTQGQFLSGLQECASLGEGKLRLQTSCTPLEKIGLASSPIYSRGIDKIHIQLI